MMNKDNIVVWTLVGFRIMLAFAFLSSLAFTAFFALSFIMAMVYLEGFYMAMSFIIMGFGACCTLGIMYVFACTFSDRVDHADAN